MSRLFWFVSESFAIAAGALGKLKVISIIRNPPSITAFAALSARSNESVRIIATARSALMRSMTARLSINAVASFVAIKLRRSERPAKVLKPVETFLDDVDTGRVAEPNRAVVAKGRAGHDRDI